MHYLTKWAFALNRMALVKRDPHYDALAIQLIKGESAPHWVCFPLCPRLLSVTVSLAIGCTAIAHPAVHPQVDS
jgi:hypothetical protein